jgi:hypothetical protein
MNLFTVAMDSNIGYPLWKNLLNCSAGQEIIVPFIVAGQLKKLLEIFPEHLSV